jgi:hypothetical protein
LYYEGIDEFWMIRDEVDNDLLALGFDSNGYDREVDSR